MAGNRFSLERSMSLRIEMEYIPQRLGRIHLRGL
jgi:hypothetical protein